MENQSTPWLRDWIETEETISGGQGIITKLHGKKDPTKRAVLKKIVPRWKDDPQALARLQKEGTILSSLHELGAKVPDVFDSSMNYESAEPFLLMEFIPGIRFDEWLKDHAPTEPSEAVTITKAIADTIKLCHEHKIGHRDLKPANIILRKSNISEPYILDFGICFDSRQTVVLTQEGEMFWNEFIILPECQDLEGEHRELRSDITALVGVFFSCLTGVPPIVLLDAQLRSPQQKYEKLLLDSSTSIEQFEQLMWFFDKGFAYRLAERFQSLNEFTSSLSDFEQSKKDHGLDVIEQFKILDETLRNTDRSVQLVSLNDKFSAIVNRIERMLPQELALLNSSNGQLTIGPLAYNRITPSQVQISSMQIGELLRPNAAQAFSIRRDPYPDAAVVLLVGFGVGMQIHFYATSYTAKTSNLGQIGKKVEWSKIAVINEEQGLEENKILVIVEALKSRLANEIRNLTRQNKQIT